jgi:hypothetical protein
MDDQDVLQVLRGVNDPEIGVNIVDLGLVYRAQRTAEGVDVALTLSTPSCPLSELLLEEAREALRTRFADAFAIKPFPVPSRRAAYPCSWSVRSNHRRLGDGCAFFR